MASWFRESFVPLVSTGAFRRNGTGSTGRCSSTTVTPHAFKVPLASGMVSPPIDEPCLSSCTACCRAGVPHRKDARRPGLCGPRLVWRCLDHGRNLGRRRRDSSLFRFIWDHTELDHESNIGILMPSSSAFHLMMSITALFFLKLTLSLDGCT